jgi:hypothetical protein
MSRPHPTSTVPGFARLMLVLALLPGCDTGEEKSPESAASPDASAAEAKPDDGPGQAKAGAPADGTAAARAGDVEVDAETLAKLEDVSGLAPVEQREGKFIFKFLPAKNTAFQPYQALFEHGRLPSLVSVLEIVRLPRSLPIVTLECGQVNAFYTSEHHAVVLCYELAHDFYTKFRKGGADDETASNQTLNALTFVLLHEMGHAVVGELELGVTGGEEDAVDDLAALLLVDAKQPGWAVDGAVSMALLDAAGKPPYFDEHSIGEQRFYNITCIVYGSDPESHGALVTGKVLPERRAVRCAKEYAQKNRAWETLLGPHIRRK